MPRRVAEIASAAGNKETELAAAASLREARLRDSELFLLVLALAAGIAAGLGVVLINFRSSLVRHLAFAVPLGSHLSEVAGVGTGPLVADADPRWSARRAHRNPATPLAPARGRRRDRGKRAVRRPDVVGRQHRAGLGDDPVGRIRRLGRARSGLYPARRGDGLAARPQHRLAPRRRAPRSWAAAPPARSPRRSTRR